MGELSSTKEGQTPQTGVLPSNIDSFIDELQKESIAVETRLAKALQKLLKLKAENLAMKKRLRFEIEECSDDNASSQHESTEAA